MGDDAFQKSGDALRRGFSTAADWMRRRMSHDSNAPPFTLSGTMQPDMDKWRQIRETVDARQNVQMHDQEISDSQKFDPVSRRASLEEGK